MKALKVETARTNRSAAVDFLRLSATGHAREAFRLYAGPGFRHHNPYFRGDADSLMVAMDDHAADHPDMELIVLHAIEEDDVVAVHSVVRPELGGPWMALAHIFRFRDGRIDELWDIGQPEPEHSPNENGMF